MNDPILIADIKRTLASEMRAAKKIKAIRALIIRWTSASTSNDL